MNLSGRFFVISYKIFIIIFYPVREMKNKKRQFGFLLHGWRRSLADDSLQEAEDESKYYRNQKSLKNF